MSEHYKLEIVDSKGMHVICGQREPLLAAYDEWKESVGQPDHLQDDIIEIEGFENEFARSPVSLAFKIGEVTSMGLVEL